MNNYLNRPAIVTSAYKQTKTLINHSNKLVSPGLFKIVIIDSKSEDKCTRVKEAGNRVFAHSMRMLQEPVSKDGLNHLFFNIGDIRGVKTTNTNEQYIVKNIVNADKIFPRFVNSIASGTCGKLLNNIRRGKILIQSFLDRITGQNSYDKQTRFRAARCSFITLSRENYKYTVKMHFEITKYNIDFKEVNYSPINVDNIRVPYFKPFANLRRMIKFGASSLIAFFIDSIMYTLLTIVLPGIVWIHVIGARLISSTVNFLINRNIIFAKGCDGKLKKHVLGYYILAAVLMAASVGVISLLKNISVNIYFAYIISTVTLFLVSFNVQKHFIFK